MHLRHLTVAVLALSVLAGCGRQDQATGAGEAAAPQSVTKLRFQSVFPSSGLFYQNSVYFTERVKAMSGGRLQIEMQPPGAVVPPFEVLDAVHKGVLDGSHSAPA